MYVLIASLAFIDDFLTGVFLIHVIGNSIVCIPISV